MSTMEYAGGGGYRRTQMIRFQERSSLLRKRVFASAYKVNSAVSRTSGKRLPLILGVAPSLRVTLIEASLLRRQVIYQDSTDGIPSWHCLSW